MAHPKSIKDRILSSVVVNPVTNCWESILAPDYTGYCRMILPDKSKILVHRASYEVFVGEIGDNLQVCHKCDNPKCCNPNHLFLGSAKENAKDRDNKGRGAKHLGEENPNHKLSESEVLDIREEYKKGKSKKYLSSKYGVGLRHITDIINRRRWGWLV